MFDLSGKRALVLGAGGGIGRAAAAALAAQGSAVTLSGRRAESLAETESIIKKQSSGAEVQSVTCDITDAKDFARLLNEIQPFDILVNSAGGAEHQPMGQITEESADKILTLNLRSAILCTQAVAEQMRKNKIAGSIINISSQMGHIGGKKRTVYCATKHGVEGMTKAAALELAEDGIRVNSICPTFVLTPMTEPFLTEPEFMREVLNNIPLGRLATPEDVAGAVVFLASSAAAMVTGTAVLVDGGWTAR